MNKVKININRERLSSDYIQSKQDFASIKTQVLTNTSLFKSTWFYGIAGLASVTLCISLAFTNSKSLEYDSITTKKESTIKSASILSNAETLYSQPSTSVVSIKNQEKLITKVPQKKKTEETSVNEISSIQNPKFIKSDETNVLASNDLIIISPTPAKVVQPQKSKKINFLPSINGTFNGEIKLSDLGSNALVVSSGFVITEFEINYSTTRGDKLRKIEGNKIYKDVLDEINNYGIDQMIFITSILAIDQNGSRTTLTPMNLVVVLD